MKPKTIAQGAEAIIYKIDNKIVKDRIKKSYRILDLDNKLRKSRTKSEAKIINKLQKIIPVPKILSDPGQGRMIHMEYIEGKKLSDYLEKLDYKKISKMIATNIAKMHNTGIIHGDLTTSNMIYDEKDDKVFFIDFGLSFHSSKIEDKAVDLHLLEQALEAKHFTIWKECIKTILDDYEKKANQGPEIIKRIKVIESRGRYKDKY
jgi:Kae1-associated kinase Bud32